MISRVYLSAVLVLAALPVVWCQCTTSRCQDSKYEPPRWENGAVYLESLLAETSKRILSAVESRLIELSATMKTSHAQLTAAMETSHAQQTATIESRLAQHAEAVDDRLATLKTELEHSTTSRLEALEERMVVENRNVTTYSEYRLNLTIGALISNMEERMVVENRNLANNSESRLNLTIGAMMNNVERRLTDQTATMESRLALLTGTMESRLADHAEAVDVGLATLKTELGNTTTDRLEALDERMVVESRNATTNSESRLNRTIGAMMNNMESHLAEYTEAVDARLTTLKTELENATTDRLEALGTTLTALCSSPASDPLISAVYYSSYAHLHILRLLQSRVPLTFLRRVDGSVNFTRDWADYRSGFGGPSGEFWLGLEALHLLTTLHQYGLRVDMEEFSGARKWASYQSFRVGSESSNYVLTVTGYNSESTAGDSMGYSNGMAFSTYDRDNDRSSSNCAGRYKGAWWYQNCAYAHLAGLYKPAGYMGGEGGINWYHAYRDWRSFKSISLKLVDN